MTPGQQYARGAVQGAAELATGLSDILPHLPGEPEHPMTGLREFADEPSESWPQTAGYETAQIAPWLIGPSGAGAELGEWAFRSAIPRVRPPVLRGAGGRFGPNPAYRARQATRMQWGQRGARVGDVAERAAQAGTIGAAEDPEHPVQGGIAGVLGGTAGPALSDLAGRVGGAVTGHVFRHGLAAGTIAGLVALGVPPQYAASVWPMFWRWTRFGRLLHNIGAAPPRAAGRVASRVPPLTAAGVVQTTRAVGGEDEPPERQAPGGDTFESRWPSPDEFQTPMP